RYKLPFVPRAVDGGALKIGGGDAGYSGLLESLGGEVASDCTSQTCAVPVILSSRSSAPPHATVFPSAESAVKYTPALCPPALNPLSGGAQKAARSLPVGTSQSLTAKPTSFSISPRDTVAETRVLLSAVNVRSKNCK